MSTMARTGGSAGLTLTAYKLPRGTIASYYPECNVLVPISHHDELSKTPASKSVPGSGRGGLMFQ